MVLIHVADHKEFRTWLRRDLLWHRIICLGKVLLNSIQQKRRITFPDTYEEDTQQLRSTHGTKLFEDYISGMRGRANASTQKLTEQAISRTVYR